MNNGQLQLDVKPVSDRTRIAETILAQLGGSRFVAMTGARNFLATEEGGLRFRVPASATRKGISLIQITLTPEDTYDLDFWKLGPGLNPVLFLIERHTGIYAEDLQGVFTAETGLDTKL